MRNTKIESDIFIPKKNAAAPIEVAAFIFVA